MPVSYHFSAVLPWIYGESMSTQCASPYTLVVSTSRSRR